MALVVKNTPANTEDIKCEALGIGVWKIVEHSFELMLNPLSPESHCGHLFKDKRSSVLVF